MLAPASTEEVAAVVRLCAEARVALVPQGGNSGMVGGATPDDSGDQLLLSLRRMNRIRHIDEAARLAVAEAGVNLETFHNDVLAHRSEVPTSELQSLMGISFAVFCLSNKKD